MNVRDPYLSVAADASKLTRGRSAEIACFNYFDPLIQSSFLKGSNHGYVVKRAGEGVSVVINGRNADRAAAVMEEIRKVGGEAKFVLGDVTTEDGSNAVIEGTKSAFDGIDILVNNVGNPTQESHGSWFDAPFQEWIDDYHQNTIAAVRLVHALTPAMKARGWGRLIQVSSRNAISPHANLPTYGAAKAALNNVTLSLPKELAGTGVTSNGIMPGLIYTPQLNKWFIEGVTILSLASSTLSRTSSTRPLVDLGSLWILQPRFASSPAR